MDQVCASSGHTEIGMESVLIKYFRKWKRRRGVIITALNSVKIWNQSWIYCLLSKLYNISEQRNKELNKKFILSWALGNTEFRHLQAFRSRSVYRLPDLSASYRHSHWSQAVADWLRNQVKKISCYQKIEMGLKISLMKAWGHDQRTVFPFLELGDRKFLFLKI